MKKSKKYRSNKERNLCPRTIICRPLRFKDKQRIIRRSKKLKNTGIYEDFCKDTMDLRKELQEKVLERQANNKISYVNYQSIVVRNRRNKAG